MNYKSSSYLKKGDHIRILCTARSADERPLQPAQKLLESWGLQVSFGTTIGKKEHQFGGTKEERLEDFQQAIDDPEIKAIWIARGGYGSVQLIDAIDFSALLPAGAQGVKMESKIIIGYSDVTLIHGKLQSQGFTSVHSFMPLELIHKPEISVESLRLAIFGESQIITIPNNDQLPQQVLKAPVVGGNLSIIYSMLGSDTFAETEDHILFIEEIDEYLYHIERMMYSLKRAGKLDHLKALLVGGMTDMNDHEVPFGKNAREIILSLTADYDYPVLFDFPAGHITDHRTLELGKQMTIEMTPKTIKFTQ
ncbi:LD-carboxypeptidase [Nonlabens sp. Ci31]|uniref:S66 peptidase family protein n=1 Tax=Nonlabens sp. Ci31 TaxID=2608253 RepID=UPI00146288F3|nr:LD-carboxypeptidase [Nonlabens sp. Ci31]QJP34089.1 LD-carboxypeptidase [Nonlabens sp. Ci31]